MLRLLISVVVVATCLAPARAEDSTAPYVVKYAAAFYTEAARRAKVEGIVKIEVALGTSGRVVERRVLQGLPLGLSEAAMAAVKSWRFNSSSERERHATVEFAFHLDPCAIQQLRFTFEAPARLHCWAQNPYVAGVPSSECLSSPHAKLSPNPSYLDSSCQSSRLVVSFSVK